MPTKIFCRRLILTFHSKMSGIEITMGPPKVRILGGKKKVIHVGLAALRSKSDMISRIGAKMTIETN